MHKRIFLLVAFLYGSVSLQAQIDSEGIHNVLIFLWAKTSKGDVRRLILIDSTGAVKKDNKPTGITLDKALFVNSLNDLISKKQVAKRGPDNNPPPAAKVPLPGKRCIYMTVTAQSDFKKDKGYYNPSSYLYFEVDKPVEDRSFELFSSMNIQERDKLLRLMFD